MKTPLPNKPDHYDMTQLVLRVVLNTHKTHFKLYINLWGEMDAERKRNQQNNKKKSKTLERL